MARVILHVDMDAFFASVEQQDQPALRGQPVVVGGDTGRGVVAAASYEARRFGVHSAMPMAMVRRLCPRAIIVFPRPDRYREVSQQIRSVFTTFTPLIEPLSLDEAFLDVTESQSLFGSGAHMASAIRAQITKTTGLTASAGIASNKFVAKIASDMQKPNGQTEAPSDAAAFLAPLPIERMWGVGEKTAALLRARGVRTFADLAKVALSHRDILGARADELRQLALGIDHRPVEPDVAAKSIGSESTFEHDLLAIDDIREALRDHAARIAARLVQESAHARIIHIKLRYADFSLVTRQRAVAQPVADSLSIGEVAESLLTTIPLTGARIRLVGVSVSGFGGATQTELFASPSTKQQEQRLRVEHALAAVRAKTGAQVAYAPRLLTTRQRAAPAGDVSHVPKRVGPKR